jgi:hypothetical protein
MTGDATLEALAARLDALADQPLADTLDAWRALDQDLAAYLSRTKPENAAQAQAFQATLGSMIARLEGVVASNAP